MFRRVTGVALVLASATLGVPQSYGDTTPTSPLYPLATCDSRVNDGPTDGIPTLNVANVNGVPTLPDPRGNVPALDITGVTLRITDTKVYAFMSVADVPDTFREPDSAYGYVMWFTKGTKIARFDVVYGNASQRAQGLAPADSTTASVGTSASGGNPLTGVGGGVDKTKNVAYVYADRLSLEAQLGDVLVEGDELTAIEGRSELWETNGQNAPGIVRRPADKTEITTVTPDKAKWKVGDDRCFPPSKLVIANATAQYGDKVTLTATLTDDAGKALAARKVSLSVPGESAPRALVTDDAGVVRVTVNAAPVAKTYPITATYRGDELSGPGVGTATLSVRTETIRIAALKVAKSGTSRTVTATLTEDDPRPFAKQPVAWYVNGKKVAVVNTDAAGRAVFKGAKAGQKVQARYLGASGRYAAANSNTVTA